MQHIGRTNGDVNLYVHLACDETAPTCDIADAFYGGWSGTLYSTVTWTALSGVEHLILVTSTAFSSGSSIPPEFELQLVDNGVGDHAFGPISPGVSTLLSPRVDARWCYDRQ
jgi:hypothetical protein